MRYAAVPFAFVLFFALGGLATAQRGEVVGNDRPPIVLRRGGIVAYAEVTDEFALRCRVKPIVVELGDRPPRFDAGDVVFAVGQQAVDAARGTEAHVVSALAPHVPPEMIAADGVPPPELSLRALKKAAPWVKRLGVVYGPLTERLVDRSESAARELGITLIRARALDGPSGVRELRRIYGQVDAIWLAPDLDLVSPQLFEYALSLQVGSALPLLAVTRQQVQLGAMIAVDESPQMVGREAAMLVNALLGGVSFPSLASHGQGGIPDVVVNAAAVRRLGADRPALLALGARFE